MLEPLPIHFDQEAHRYCWTPTGHWMRHSITKVVNNKTPRELEKINETKDGPSGWALRGTTIHRFMELFLTTGDPGDLGEWAEYIEPALKHRLWKTYEPVACEYRVADLARSIGGSFDALLRNKDDGRLVLLDFKSQGNADAKKYSVAKQLGGYTHLLQQHHRLIIHKLIGFWIRPGACELSTHEVDESVAAYQVARDLYLEANVPF
jgi:hypothetical protein